MISDFKQLLDLNDVQYVTEGDGRLITDCPLCSEDGRQSKLTIYPDGNLSCIRFASVGGDDLKIHTTEVRKIWQTGSGDADSLSSILFDGTLTLAIKPEGKSYFVQATNCNKVLHIDTFNPTNAPKRTAFVNKLPGYSEEQKSEIREALVELAVRARETQAVIDNVPEARTVAAASIRLEDGRCAELTTRGFAVYDPTTRSTGYATSLEDSDGTIYVPLVTEAGAQNIGLYLPTGVDEYHTEGELDKEVSNFIKKYVDISDQDRAIASKYVFMSYRAEDLFEIPYLRAVGDSGNGKTRLTQAVGLLCSRPIFTIGITPAVLFRINHSHKPTLIIDEFNVESKGDDTEAIIQVLNAGISRTNRVIRCSGDGSNFAPEGFDPFGPKILAGLKGTDSQPFESRTYPIRMEQTKRNDITIQLTREMLKEATILRNKLTLWKLRTQGDDLSERLLLAETELKAAGNIRSRYISPRTRRRPGQ